MKINEIFVKADDQSLDPALLININFEILKENEIPVSISGVLLIDDKKIISHLTESIFTSNNKLFIKLIRKEYKNALLSGIPAQYNVILSCPISQKAIDFIEEQRDKSIDKSVNLSFKITVKYFTSPASFDTLQVNNLLELNFMEFYEKIHINQSDWIQKFSEQLGIGKFLLLELQIPNDNNVSDFWKEFHNNLSNTVKEMELNIRKGEWKNVMYNARIFFDKIKIGDNRLGNKAFKEEFETLLMLEQHNSEGIKNFYDALWQLFEFYSKFVHPTDRQAFDKPIPSSSKEDAYFAYTLATGLLNFVSKKISK